MFQMVVSLYLESYVQKGDQPVLHGIVVVKRSYVLPENLQLEFVYWKTEFHYSDLYIACCWFQV
jgi:hypothetical protein